MDKNSVPRSEQKTPRSGFSISSYFDTMTMLVRFRRPWCFCCSSGTLNRDVFPFFKLWPLYPAILGQAIPSAFGQLRLALTIQKGCWLWAMSFLWLLVYSLLQRRVRKNLEHESEPLVIPGNRKTFNPTGTMLLQMLESMSIIRMQTDTGIQRMLPKNQVTKNIAKMLRLAGFSEEIYYAVRNSSNDR